MQWSEFATTRAACSYFFIAPGLVYGLLTARLPVLKEQIGADEAQIGLILLCFGTSGLVALCSSALLIARLGSRNVLRFGSLLLLFSLPLCALTSTPVTFAFTCILVGTGIGLTDVAMNSQGIEIEIRYQKPCMAFMHAAYGVGGLTGSLTGALFAALHCTPLTNFLVVLAVYACFCPLALPCLLPDVVRERQARTERRRKIPLFVLSCGLLAMFVYSIEGSVAEWGSLLLFSVKGADEQTAALVFGAFSITTVCCRFCADRLRGWIGDFPLAFCGAVLAAIGMALVLFSPEPILCLAGYACMGMGLAPIVPISFSRAGTYPGVTSGEASTTVSLFGYGGLLCTPPILGWFAHRIGLGNALMIVFGLCCCLTMGTLFLRHVPKR